MKTKTPSKAGGSVSSLGGDGSEHTRPAKFRKNCRLCKCWFSSRETTEAGWQRDTCGDCLTSLPDIHRVPPQATCLQCAGRFLVRDEGPFADTFCRPCLDGGRRPR